jgi:predicted amidohydrolase
MKLTIATCQFPIDRDIGRNMRYILGQMDSAKKSGAHVVHFSELALSGYAGAEFDSIDELDWDELRDATDQIMARARQKKIWVILGSTHRLSGRNKPHNSLYIINPEGRIVNRYDKMYCTGSRKGTDSDLAHYSPGERFVVFKIRGVQCGVLICHDFRYDELYREYKRRNVQVMFHSYHNGHIDPRKWKKVNDPALRRLNHAANIHGIIVPPTMQAYAANNYMWISSNNTSARESSWPSFVVRPDGVITDRLERNRAGILVTTINTENQYYDAAGAWRDRAMRGIYHSGSLVRDPRSRNRRAL